MPTTNANMNEMMRKRRQDMADMPAYEPPSEEKTEPVDSPAEEATEAPEGMTVAAPGEPSTGETFEYEPSTDTPGAWMVYPPGVPCDDTAYRVQMSKPAGEADFSKMQKALDDAGATSPEPAVESTGSPGEGSDY